MADQTTDALVEEVEKDLLAAIVKNLEANTMTPEQAENIAQEFLALLPMQDKHDLLEKLGKFSKSHIEAKSLYVKYGGPIEDEERLKKIDLMSKHIQNGQIEHALKVAKGVSNG